MGQTITFMGRSINYGSTDNLWVGDKVIVGDKFLGSAINVWVGDKFTGRPINLWIGDILWVGDKVWGRPIKWVGDEVMGRR